MVCEGYTARPLPLTAITSVVPIRLTKWPPPISSARMGASLQERGFGRARGSERSSLVAFHHVADNLMQDGETAANVQVMSLP